MSEPLLKVNYYELRPHEFRARMAEQPIGYLALGTVEWHGEHNPYGTDALGTAGIFEHAARKFGGIVFPPLWLGPDRIRLESDGTLLQGMDYAAETTPPRQLDGNCYRIGNGLFLVICEAILEQAKRAGFKLIVADGHGPSRYAFGAASDGWEQQFGIKIICVSRDIKEGWRGGGDHAALNETSQMMAVRPDLVDLSRLSPDRSVWPQGVMGKDPRDATPEYGERTIAESLDILGAKLAELGFLR
jgi:creatinine amidohydrolase